jgi:hypothetical protein
MKIIFGKKLQVPIDRIFLLAINMMFIYLFVFRNIPSSLDDENYLYHFSVQQFIRDSEFTTNEYLYSLFTRIFSTTDGLLGVRLLILFGLILQFICQLKFHGVRSWLYMCGYYLLPNLAIMYSYTQLRFGLGLGLVCLAFCLDYKKNSLGQIFLIILAAQFHTGFIILITLYIVCRYFYVKKKILTKYFLIEAAGLSIAALLSVYLFISAQDDSRYVQYSEFGLNSFGLAQYILPFASFAFTQYLFEKKLSFETVFLVLLVGILIAFNFFGITPGALPRIFNVALMISIISALKSSHSSKYGVIYCILLYAIWVFILSISAEGLSGFNNWNNIL